MEFPSGILQVCGDSFAGQGVGFGGWYSPIALHVETDSIDDPTGVRYDGVTGTDKPLLADPTPPGDIAVAGGRRADQPRQLHDGDHREGSAAAVLAVGESRSGAGQLADTARARSATPATKAAGRARSAATTTRSRRRTHRPAGCTSSPTISTAPARWCSYRAKRETFADRASWQGWSSGGPDGGWNKPPTPLWPDRVGEMSVRQIDGKTVLSYFNASNGNMEVRVADDPTQLGTAPVTTVGIRQRVAGSRRAICRRPRSTGWRSPTAATSRRDPRSTKCGCSSASGTPCRALRRRTASSSSR